MTCVGGRPIFVRSRDVDVITAAGPFVGATFAGTITVLVSIWANRRLGVDAARARLLQTLQDTNEAQQHEIDRLKREVADKDARIAHLEQVVDDLEAKVNRLERRRVPRPD